MKKAVKVSVIVPIFNVEKYLYKCLYSITKQTLKEIEIILINDGSTDNSIEIALSFFQKDNRIKLISQENSGQSIARNRGLSIASGDYIVFVDSDDWIESNMLEKLYNNICIQNSDFSCCRISFENYISGKRSIHGHEFRFKELYAPTILEEALYAREIYVCPCNKIYNRLFLVSNNLTFEPGIVNEDTLFTIQIASCAKKVSFINNILYHVIEREGSTSRSSYDRLFLDMNKALQKSKNYLIDKGSFKKVEHIYKVRYLKSMLYNLLQSAQRLPYQEYLSVYYLCMKQTFYLKYNIYYIYKELSLKYRLLLLISKKPILLYKTMKVLNTLSIYMH